MLSYPLAIALYDRFCCASQEWLKLHLELIALSALLIRRKCGREEAKTFICLMRLALGLPVE